MKSLIAALLFLVISLTTKAQTEISVEDLAKHIGNSISITGKVFRTKTVSNGKMLLISVGGPFFLINC